MQEPVIVEAARTPIGRRGRGLAGLHPADLLAAPLRAVLERTQVDPGDVEQLVGGCVTTVNEQAGNVTRNAWLGQGYPYHVGATTVDCACGSGQQANGIIAGLVSGDTIKIGIACGVESMSTIGLHANKPKGIDVIKPPGYPADVPTQFVAADRIAERRNLTRAELDHMGLISQERAARAWAEGRFDREIVPVEAPVIDDEGRPTDESQVVERDEGLRDTSIEVLAGLRPLAEGSLHTAGTASQISDGAAAVLWMDREEAVRRGLRPRGRFVAHVLVGAEPRYLLDGPIDATRAVLKKAGLQLDEMDLIEINEAFASVPLSWLKTMGGDPERMNVNGGAIALGHPVGSTGSRLVVTALHELERTGGRYALLLMCAGGALATGSVLERL